MNPSDRDKAKACCNEEYEKLVEHLKHCDASSQTETQRHHCYRHAAWRSGRQTRKCIEKNSPA